MENLVLVFVATLAIAGAVVGGQQHTPLTEEAPAVLGDAARGEFLYQRRCGACHSIGQNRIGPKHEKTFGSKAGSVEDFDYSKALQDLNVIWNEKTLDEWLQNPAKMAPGTRMGFRLTNEQERADIIAYLRKVADAAAANTN